MLSIEKLACFSGTSEQQVEGKTGEKKFLVYLRKSLKERRERLTRIIASLIQDNNQQGNLKQQLS